jgi:cephalosporin hydroxylase
MLLGEATFHQLHGGVSTNAVPERQAENVARWVAQFASIRGGPWHPPPVPRPVTYLGTLPRPALERLVRAAVQPGKRSFTPPLGADVRPDDVGPGSRPPAGDGRITRLVELATGEFRAGRFEACCGVARLLAGRAPEEPALERMLALVAPMVSFEGPAPEHRAEYHIALGQAHEILGAVERAAEHFRLALASAPNSPSAHIGLSQLRMPGDSYLVWLERLYGALAPETVIEIGVYQGSSLALLRPPTIAIGIDPDARLLHPLTTQTHVFPETSTSFFARRGADALLGPRPLSVGFIDGMHVFEEALRDFIELEALCGEHSVIILHDTVPLDEATQTRSQETAFWSGDVWKVVLCLKQYRPELDIFTIAAAPTGLTVVTGLNPASRVLADAFDEAVARFVDEPFASLAGDLTGALNIVPNDWAIVEARLTARHILPPNRPAVAGNVGPHIVDREQPSLTAEQVETVRAFHDLYYTRWSKAGGDTINTSWFGNQTVKCPLDLWIYQELLVRTRPDVIVETGTWRGGSALYLAMILDQVGHGRVITIDVQDVKDRPRHPRITYVSGSSTDPAIVRAVHGMVDGARALVILDSDHSEAHVYDEIAAYRSLVQPGDYLIVEDTNVNGHPTFPEFGPGPMEAVTRFLSECDDFEVDRRCERFLMTLNPSGYLRRKRSAE